MASQLYDCLFARNYDKKKKTWRDGVITAQETLRFVRVMLYELDDENRVVGSPIDVFDLFNHKYDRLTGEMITSTKFIVKICGVKMDMKVPMIPHLSKVDRGPTLLAGKSLRRAPALGTCGTFKKYRITQGSSPKGPCALPNVPGYGDDYSYNAGPSEAVNVKGLHDVNLRQSLPPYSNPHSSHMNKSQVISAPDRSAVYTTTSSYPSEKCLPSVSPRSSIQKGSNVQPFQNLATPITQTGYPAKTTAEGLVSGGTHILPSAKVCQVNSLVQHSQAQNPNSADGVFSPSNSNLPSNVTSPKNIDARLYEDILEDLVKPGCSDTSYSAECDSATIVDSELIDCIESALDHYGEFSGDI